MELVTELINTTKEKNIPDSEVQIALAAFLSSAINQAMTECNITNDKLDQNNLHLLQTQLENAQSIEDIKGFNLEFNTQFSSETNSFQEVVQRTFDQLLTQFLEKIKML